MEFKLEAGRGAGSWTRIRVPSGPRANDGLGMALFYRSNMIASGPQESEDMLYVRFADSKAIDYAFAAAWTQDRQGVTSLSEFENWLVARVNELASRP